MIFSPNLLMQKPLIILSLVLSLASAGVGYINLNKLKDAKQTATECQKSKDDLLKKLASSSAEIKSLHDQLANTGSDSNKVSAQISDLQSQKDKAIADNEELQKAVTQKDADLIQAKKDLEAAQQALAEAQKGGSTSTNNSTALDALTTSNKELQVINDSQKEKIKDLETQVTQFRKREAQRRNKMLKQGLEGKILAVNPSWNFVVLSLGDRNGVVSNAEMLIKRDSQLIGRVKITSVEPSTSIADIIASSVKKGFSVQPGDSVIYMGPGSDSDNSDR
jgi:vacuolar-type H+-ATPase subunit I/STV1